MATPFIFVDSQYLYIFFSNHSIINLGPKEAEFRKQLTKAGARYANKDGTVGWGFGIINASNAEEAQNRTKQLEIMFERGIFDALSVGTYRQLFSYPLDCFRLGSLTWMNPKPLTLRQ
jgi:hypothetical protein